MRFIILLVLSQLGESVSRNLLSASIRPHSRFLIQSVLKSSDELKGMSSFIDKEEKGFCREPSSLQLIDNARSTLGMQHTKTAQVLVSSSHDFLGKLSTATRGDDVRRATEMKKVWDESIVAEIQALDAAVDQMISTLESDKHNAEELMETAFHDAGDPEPKRYLPGNPHYAVSPEEHTNSGRLKMSVPFLGSRAHSIDQWHERIGSSTEQIQSLTILKENLVKMKSDTESLLSKHVGTVESNDGFLLKLGEQKVEEKAGETSDILAEIRSKEASPKSTDDANVATLQELEKQTTKLNVLYVRKLGLLDAQKSLERLKKEVTDKLDSSKTSVISTLAEIQQTIDSEEFKAEAMNAYTEAIRLKGVSIETNFELGGSDSLDVHMNELAQFVGVDGRGEFIPHVNLIVNVLYRLHGHMLAFTEEYKAMFNSDAEWVIGAELRKSADCLLYGRVDALLRRFILKDETSPETEESLCGNLHKKAMGMQAMKDFATTPGGDS